MSLPSLQHVAWMEIQALGLLSEPSQGQNPAAWSSGSTEAGAGLCCTRPCHGEPQPRAGLRSRICYEAQMCHGSRGRCGCLWPPASFPSSQAKSRACYQEQKMCHLCCISFPFLHLFPARCASEITALGAGAGERGRQRPRQPYRRLAGRKEIRKFAEIFGQQNKYFCCQKPNGQPGQPAAICTAPWLQPSGAPCPPSPAAVPPYRRVPVPGMCQLWGQGPQHGSPIHSTTGAAPGVHPNLAQCCPSCAPGPWAGARVGRGLCPSAVPGERGGE